MKPIFIAGPCVIESAELLDTVAARLAALNRTYGLDIIFKASFDKANRTSIRSFRGPGLERGLQMLADIKARYGLRLLTDIHESCQAEAAGQVVDVLQIPAFLCRQTDLLVAAARTGRVVNVKKDNLVVDFRNLPAMKAYPDTVIMDCTHCVQRPGAAGGKTGGDRQFIPAMALAAKAFGATGYFFETHPQPDAALSDGPNMLPLDELETVITSLL